MGSSFICSSSLGLKFRSKGFRYKFGDLSSFCWPMNKIKEVTRINEEELKRGVVGGTTPGSWHAQYKESAYVFAGGLPYSECSRPNRPMERACGTNSD